MHSTRWVTAGEGESDFHSLEVELRLGSAAFADSIRVTWPGGQEQTLWEVEANQIISMTQSSSISAIDSAPAAFAFNHLTNHPNPFNPATEISFILAERQNVVLRIFDIQGRMVRTLLDETAEQGRHAVHWEGDNDLGQTIASGVYFCRLSLRGASGIQKTTTRKTILHK